MFHLLWISSLIFIILVGFNAVLQVNSQLVQVFIKSNKTIRNEIETSQISFQDVEDVVFALRIGDDFYVTTAQAQFRRFPPPEEQVCTVTVDGMTDASKVKAKEVYFHPEFGFLTLANNIALMKIVFDPRPKETDTIRVLRNTVLKINDQLTWFSKVNDQGMKQNVTVVDFKKCEEAFDPKELYILDANEQFCTTAPKAWADQTVEHFINGILFVEVDKYNSNLIGIESMSNGKLSVSTFIPYHCDFFKLVAGKELCQ